MKDTLCVIMGGGRGTRLYPLTHERSKPAVPLAGKYRLIDVTVSNCLNSGLNRIYVLTQFNSLSLNSHIAQTYRLDRFSHGFVEVLAAKQSMEGSDWFQGTADAVRQCLVHFDEPWVKRILILSGDQLYKLDFARLLAFHAERGAELTVACCPVGPDEVSDYGIMATDGDAALTGLVEKPETLEDVQDAAVDINGRETFLASMGIYVFERQTLVEMLTATDEVDFAKGVIPRVLADRPAAAYVHHGYWKDIGTIRSFYEENLMLTDPLPRMDLFDNDWPFFSRPRNLPPAKVIASRIVGSMIADGAIIEDAEIRHSVIGLRSRIGKESVIEDAVVFGSDFFETVDEIDVNKVRGLPSVGVGRRCRIRGAILDKDVRIGDDVRITNEAGVTDREGEGEGIYIRNGIVIVTKGTVIPDGTTI